MSLNPANPLSPLSPVNPFNPSNPVGVFAKKKSTDITDTLTVLQNVSDTDVYVHIGFVCALALLTFLFYLLITIFVSLWEYFWLWVKYDSRFFFSSLRAYFDFWKDWFLFRYRKYKYYLKKGDK